jgi:hypothetical protein
VRYSGNREVKHRLSKETGLRCAGRNSYEIVERAKEKSVSSRSVHCGLYRIKRREYSAGG